MIGKEEIIDLQCLSGKEREMGKEFEEIRFGECNLMDMEIEEGEKTAVEMSQYEYERFLEGREIVI